MSSSDLNISGAPGELEPADNAVGDSFINRVEGSLLSVLTMPASNHCLLKLVMEPSMMTKEWSKLGASWERGGGRRINVADISLKEELD